jgi:hypothetical protein
MMHGKIPFPECPPMPYGRNIEYVFPSRKMNKCTCDLIIRGSENLAKRLPRSQLPQVEPTVKEPVNTETNTVALPKTDRIETLENEIAKLKHEQIADFAKRHVPSVDELKQAFDRECEKMQQNAQDLEK